MNYPIDPIDTSPIASDNQASEGKLALQQEQEASVPNPTMEPQDSEGLTGLEKDVQRLSVVEKSDSHSDLLQPTAVHPAKADPATVKRALIVTILKDEMKTESEERMRGLANDACAGTTVNDVQAVIDPLCDDHFFLLFSRPSQILDNFSLIRRGPLQGQVTVRKVAETTPAVQERFLELAADPARCFPVEKREKDDKRSSTAKASTVGAVAAEPSTPRPDDSRKARGPTSGHVARRLVEGSLGIRSSVTREQVKKENELVASAAAEKRETRKKEKEVTSQVKEAFE